MKVKVRGYSVNIFGESYYHPDLFKYEGQFIRVEDYFGQLVASTITDTPVGIPICVLKECSVLPHEYNGESKGRVCGGRAKAACDKLKELREAMECAKRKALNQWSLSQKEEDFLKISWKLSSSLSGKEIWRLMRAILPSSTCTIEDAKAFLLSLPKDGGRS